MKTYFSNLWKLALLALPFLGTAAEFTTPTRFSAPVEFGAWTNTVRVVLATNASGGASAATGTFSYAVQPTNDQGRGVTSPSSNAAFTATGQLIRIRWTPAGGATGYRVFRGLTNWIDVGSATQFIDWGTNTWSNGTPTTTTTAGAISGPLVLPTNSFLGSVAESNRVARMGDISAGSVTNDQWLEDVEALGAAFSNQFTGLLATNLSGVAKITLTGTNTTIGIHAGEYQTAAPAQNAVGGRIQLFKTNGASPGAITIATSTSTGKVQITSTEALSISSALGTSFNGYNATNLGTIYLTNGLTTAGSQTPAMPIYGGAINNKAYVNSGFSNIINEIDNFFDIRTASNHVLRLYSLQTNTMEAREILDRWNFDMGTNELFAAGFGIQSGWGAHIPTQAVYQFAVHTTARGTNNFAHDAQFKVSSVAAGGMLTAFTLQSEGNALFTGQVTAASFYGDGSGLTNMFFATNFLRRDITELHSGETAEINWDSSSGTGFLLDFSQANRSFYLFQPTLATFYMTDNTNLSTIYFSTGGVSVVGGKFTGDGSGLTNITGTGGASLTTNAVVKLPAMRGFWDASSDVPTNGGGAMAFEPPFTTSTLFRASFRTISTAAVSRVIRGAPVSLSSVETNWLWFDIDHVGTNAATIQFTAAGATSVLFSANLTTTGVYRIDGTNAAGNRELIPYLYVTNAGPGSTNFSRTWMPIIRAVVQ